MHNNPSNRDSKRIGGGSEGISGVNHPESTEEAGNKLIVLKVCMSITVRAIVGAYNSC